MDVTDRGEREEGARVERGRQREGGGGEKIKERTRDFRELQLITVNDVGATVSQLIMLDHNIITLNRETL